MQNRKLWINAIINSLQCELEVIRTEHLAEKNGTPEGKLQCKFDKAIDEFNERRKRVPFRDI